MAVSSKGTTSPLPRVFAVIIAASAQATSSRGFAACSGPTAMPVEAVRPPTASASSSAKRVAEALGERERAREVAGGEDDRELLAADAADDVRRADGGAQHVRHLEQQLVADAVAVHVVDLLEVVEVEHHERDGVVLRRRAHELLAHAVVKRAVVVEAGERVGRGLVLEARADVRVVECERGRVAEAGREDELLVRELRVLADAVDVERPLELAARDERNRDQRLRLDRRARDEADPRVEVRLVGEHGLAVLDRPAGDALAEREALAHDLVRPLAAREHGYQLALRLVGLVDVDVLVRDELGERVRDPLEQRVEALLGEHVVEDLGEAAIWLDGAQARSTPPRFRWGRRQVHGLCRRLDGRRVRHRSLPGRSIGHVRAALDENPSAKIRGVERSARRAGRAARRLIDHAPLFPPASLDLPDALARGSACTARAGPRSPWSRSSGRLRACMSSPRQPTRSSASCSTTTWIHAS